MENIEKRKEMHIKYGMSADICRDFKPQSCFVDVFNTNKKYNIIYADPPWTYEKTGGLKNSRKPDIVREKIIELCGDLPRIELFARQQIDNWDCWGDEC